MSNTLKIIIGVAAALVFGFVVGYFLGRSGKGDLAAAAKRERIHAEEVEAARKDLEQTCERKAKPPCRLARLFLPRVHLA